MESAYFSPTKSYTNMSSMSLQDSSLTSFLPNLPGYRSSSSSPIKESNGRKSLFVKVQGECIYKEEPDIQTTLLDMNDLSSTSIVSTTALQHHKKIKFHEEYANVIMNFKAFYEDQIFENKPPTIRKCIIQYFAESGEIAMKELQSRNSGLPFGPIVKRQILYKADLTTPIDAYDLFPGSLVTIFTRNYRIVECDDVAKKFYYKNYEIEADQIPVYCIPEDEYENERESIDNGPTDDWLKYRSKPNFSKKFHEARLGKFVDNSGRDAFIRFGDKKLSFFCTWNDMNSLYGQLKRFRLVYHLCDDTVEIFILNDINDGNDITFSRLLQRSKLYKNYEITATSSGSFKSNGEEGEFYKWFDFQIGLTFRVFSRDLEIIDADTPTRDFFHSQGLELLESIEKPKDRITPPIRSIPVHIGFGSEEDSLRSCIGSLQINPPLHKKYNEDKVLSFTAKMITTIEQDHTRDFVVMFYVMDNTIKILEPPIRNSGFTGGTFLSRRSIKLDDSNEFLKPQDMFIGAKLQILKYTFILLETNIETLKWFEDKAYFFANYKQILYKIIKSNSLIRNDIINGSLESKFALLSNISKLNHDHATLSTLRQVMDSYGLIDKDILTKKEMNLNMLSEHELLTIFRFDGNYQSNAISFDYVKFCDELKQFSSIPLI